MSARQVAKDVSYTEGFIARSSCYTARCPCSAYNHVRIGTSLFSGGIQKAISGNGVGDGLYLHKHDKCYRAQKLKGNGLYLAPHPRFVEGDGKSSSVEKGDSNKWKVR